MLLRTAAIYSITYSRWVKNRKVYAFILYAGSGPKVHALNLGAREIGTIGRTKLANIIARLSKVPAAKKWDGATLYRIFRTYLPKEVALSYRTYFKAHIPQASLINYGFNSPDSFTDLDLAQNNPALYSAAGRDLFVKLLNTYTGRGVKMKAVEKSLAVAGTAAKTPATVVETKAPIVKKEVKKEINKEAKVNTGNDPEIGGYY
jgi:hypothetical protein